MKGLIGKKLGMTQLFDQRGNVIPVTAVEAGPCVVTQVKTVENDGYKAFQYGFGEIKAGKVNKPMAGHFKKNDVAPTCTKPGYIDYACKYCGLQKRLRTKDPLGHHYTRTVLVQPTEKTTGIARYKCSRCGDTYRVTLPVHKHKYREIDRSLPCKFYNTQITYRCVECGKQIEKTGGKGEGHTVINGVCVVCGLAAGTGAIQNEALLSTPFAPLVIIFDRVVAILHVFRDSGLTAKSISIIRSWPPLTDVLRAFRNR